MKILKTIFGGGAEKLVESVGGVLDNLSPLRKCLRRREHHMNPGGLQSIAF